MVTGDLAGLAGMRQVAEQADAAGPFDAVIHNAGVGHRDPAHRVTTEDGLCLVFAVNVLAPGSPGWSCPRERGRAFGRRVAAARTA